MNKPGLSLILVLVLLSCNSLLSQIGQRQNITDTKPEKPEFVKKLWYGGNVSLNLISRSSYTQFHVGISPMVGYKFTDWFSLGPRLSLEYNHFRVIYSNNHVDKFNVFTDTYAAFARAKVFRVIFAHLEYGITSIPVEDYSQGGYRISKQYFEQAQIGVGYNGGYEKFSSEIMLLYNVSNNELSFYNPFEIRFGITYNF